MSDVEVEVVRLPDGTEARVWMDGEVLNAEATVNGRTARVRQNLGKPARPPESRRPRRPAGWSMGLDPDQVVVRRREAEPSYDRPERPRRGQPEITGIGNYTVVPARKQPPRHPERDPASLDRALAKAAEGAETVLRRISP